MIKKEILLLGKAKNGFISTLVLMLAFIFIFHYSLEKSIKLDSISLIGLKWSIVFILSFVYISQSLWEERENGADKINRIYLPVWISYLIKSFTIFIALIGLEFILILFFYFFYESFVITSDTIFGQFVFLIPGTLTLSFLGIALNQISHATRLKEIILPMLLIPISLPVMVFGMEAERKFFIEGFSINSLLLMLSFSILYGTLGVLLYEFGESEL